MVLGGNQSDAINIRAFPLDRVTGYRWPVNVAKISGHFLDDWCNIWRVNHDLGIRESILEANGWRSRLLLSSWPALSLPGMSTVISSTRPGGILPTRRGN
jgi:hypothetical protein